MIAILIVFGMMVVGWAAGLIYDYIRYQDGIPVEGRISDVDSTRSGGRRRWEATVVGKIDGVKVIERVYLPTSGLSIGGTRISSSRAAIGDTIEMLALRDGDTYSMKIAEVVMNPWKGLFLLFLSLVMIVLSLIVAIKERRTQTQPRIR